MSSGPSKRNEKPRAAIVDLRRGDAEIEQHAVDALDAERVRARRASSENHARRKTKRGSPMRARGRFRGRDRGRARPGVRPGRAPRGSRARGRRGRTCASTYVAVRSRSPAPRRLLRAGREHVRHRPSKARSRRARAAGRPAGNAIACAVSACHCASSHSSNLWPWPTSTTCLSRLA